MNVHFIPHCLLFLKYPDTVFYRVRNRFWWFIQRTIWTNVIWFKPFCKPIWTIHWKENNVSIEWFIHRWLASLVQSTEIWDTHSNCWNIGRESVSWVPTVFVYVQVCFCALLSWNLSWITHSPSPFTENQKRRQQFWPGLHPWGAGAHPGRRRHYQANQPGRVQRLLLLRWWDSVLKLKPPSLALYFAHKCAANAVNTHELTVDHHSPRSRCFHLKVDS